MVLGLWRRRPRWPQITRQAFYREVIESDRPVIVELWRRDLDDAYEVFERALDPVARRHRDSFKLVRIDVAEFQDLLDAYREHRGYGTWDLDRLPAAALFRKGALVTTFNPTLPLEDPSLQVHDIRYQFERFLQKFIYYDPSKVTFNHKKPDSPAGAKKPAMPAGAAVAHGPGGVAGAGASDREARIAAAKAAAAAKLAARQAAGRQQEQVERPGPQRTPAEGDPEREARIAAAKAAAMAKLAARRQAEGQGEGAPATPGPQDGEERPAAEPSQEG